MCCFSRAVKSVSSTRIFARFADSGRQQLVYSMKLDAKEELAMVLPLPVTRARGMEPLTFIDLHAYSEFFDDLEDGFVPPSSNRSVAKGKDVLRGRPKLEVISVGSYEASYVPTIEDFSRLDERFAIPAKTWAALPGYASFGFAVFKLKPGSATVHPMALSFVSAEPEQLFFPTVHIHDGKVHKTAAFDHTLYLQPSVGKFPSDKAWIASTQPTSSFMKLERASDLIAPNQHCYRRVLKGKRANEDSRATF